MKQKKAIQLPSVKSLTSLSRTTILRLVKKGKFPKPFKIADRTNVWLESDVMNYIDECMLGNKDKS